MKRIGLSIAAVLLGASMAFAQQKAPTEVQKAFADKFPEAKSVKWEKESDGGWEAEFKMNGNKVSVEFDSKGAWSQTETEIKTSELPEAVRDAIKSNFEGYTADEAEMVETADGEVNYEVDMEKGKAELEVLFAADGKVLKKMRETEDDNGDED